MRRIFSCTIFVHFFIMVKDCSTPTLAGNHFVQMAFTMESSSLVDGLQRKRGEGRGREDAKDRINTFYISILIYPFTISIYLVMKPG